MYENCLKNKQFEYPIYIDVEDTHHQSKTKNGTTEAIIGFCETLEDLVSIGSIGLIKGINTYKIDKNIRLATYASRCISNEILMFIRKNKKRNKDISLEDALTYDGEGNELHLEDIVGTTEDLVYKEYEKMVDIESLKKYIETLDERDKRIMIMRYGLNKGEEYTQKEVASILGISQSYISRIEKKVIKKLKNVLD